MEKRLIDANALKNDINAQIAILNAMSVSTGIDELRQIGEKLQQGMIAEIDKQPTVDAVPVVLCKDCKHHKVFKNGVNGWCNGHGFPTDVTYFCADGERRNENERANQ